MHGNKGKKRTPEQIEKYRLTSLGRKHSPEAKEKIRLASIGRKFSDVTRKRISTAKMKENAGYGSIHDWVRRWKGTPNLCENCGATDRYMNWANIDHQYKRVLEDYIRLCVPCHREFDKKFD